MNRFKTGHDSWVMYSTRRFIYAWVNPLLVNFRVCTLGEAGSVKKRIRMEFLSMRCLLKEMVVTSLVS